MSDIKMPDKDPDDELDYAIDWVERLAGDTIADSDAFLADDDASGVEVFGQSFFGTRQTVWLKGGIAGQTARVTCRINSAGGRQWDRTFRVRIKER